MAQDIDDDTSIALQPDAIHPFGISPNPANQKVLVVLSAPAPQDSPIEITDMLGRLRKSSLIEKNSREKSIVVEDMESGIYIVNIKDGKRYRQRQLVILR
ncbi:MAG: T9SS type A sorting domain-containing protein [Bacteroidota bacterium]